MQGAPLLARLGLVLLPLLLPLLASVAPQPTLGFMVLAGVLAVAVFGWQLSGLALVGLIALVAVSPEYRVAGQATTIIALHKGATIGLVGVIVAQRGFSGQFNGPTYAFLLGGLMPILAGQTFPGLQLGEMARSLIGSIAPFAIISARTDRRTHGLIILAAAAAPLISIVAGVLLMPTGHRLFGIDQTGVMRLQGASISAFLGYLGEIGTFAAFAEFVLTGRRQWLFLAGGAYLSIVASGTRVPMATALLFCLLVLLFARGPHFGVMPRVRLWLAGLAGFTAGAIAIGPRLVARTFGGAGGGINVSGRDVIWPIFTAAIARYPLFGQGIGTGRFLAPEEEIRYIGTQAVHNEYLRLSADMGLVGVLGLVLGHVLWVRSSWPVLQQAERVVVLAFGLAFGLHCISDNTLIAPQAMILYAWLATFLERARRRAEDQGRLRRRTHPLARMIRG